MGTECLAHTSTHSRNLKMRAIGVHLRRLVGCHDIEVFYAHEVFAWRRGLWDGKVHLHNGLAVIRELNVATDLLYHMTPIQLSRL